MEAWLVFRGSFERASVKSSVWHVIGVGTGALGLGEVGERAEVVATEDLRR